MNPILPVDDYVQFSKPLTSLLSMWFNVNNKLVVDEPVELSDVVRCLTDIGVVRIPARKIWRLIEKSNIENPVQFDDLMAVILAIMALCPPSYMWMESAAIWIAQNHERLVERSLLDVVDFPPARMN